MRQLILFTIISSFLIQASVKTVMLADWLVHREEITREYCINKDKPEMQCKGQCYLAKKMRKLESAYEESKQPFTPKNSKTLDFVLFCVVPSTSNSVSLTTPKSNEKGGLYTLSATSVLLETDFPPPQFTC